jgi:hypothetical protein
MRISNNNNTNSQTTQAPIEHFNSFSINASLAKSELKTEQGVDEYVEPLREALKKNLGIIGPLAWGKGFSISAKFIWKNLLPHL